MPTPSHNLRIPDEVWIPAVERAKDQHENVTAVVVRGLRAYLNEPSWQQRALAAEAQLARVEDGWRATNAECIAHWNRADAAEARALAAEDELRRIKGEQ